MIKDDIITFGDYKWRVLDIKDGKALIIAEHALNCGYYDQSHFNRDFKRFSGITPGEYFASQATADNFVQLAS